MPIPPVCSRHGCGTSILAEAGNMKDLCSRLGHARRHAPCRKRLCLNAEPAKGLHAPDSTVMVHHCRHAHGYRHGACADMADAAAPRADPACTLTAQMHDLRTCGGGGCCGGGCGCGDYDPLLWPYPVAAAEDITAAAGALSVGCSDARFSSRRRTRAERVKKTAA